MAREKKPPKPKTPVVINEVTRRLYAAATKLAGERADQPRHRPSPSSVSSCTRANWFSETGVPRTETPDPEAWIAAETGTLSEELHIKIVEAAGLGRIDPLTPEERELLPVQYKSMNFRGGQLDQLLVTVHAGVDEDVKLLEFKRLSYRDIKDLYTTNALSESKPDHHDQMQSLMQALGLNEGLYFGINWDRGALTALTHGFETRPPGFYAEWIKLSPVAPNMLAERAGMQEYHIRNTKLARDVPRDYDPRPRKDSPWQCRWCLWRGACLNAEGVKWTPRMVGLQDD